MTTLRGTVTKIKIIDYPLVYFRLDDVNCLIAQHSLNFLADVKEDMRIVVFGEYNSRNQFIVKKYSVLGKTRIMLEVESMRRFNRHKSF